MTPRLATLLLTILLVGSAHADQLVWAEDSRGNVVRPEQQQLTLTSYHSERPPRLHLDQTVLRCRLNGRKCPLAPIELRLPSTVATKRSVRMTLELATKTTSKRFTIRMLPDDFPWFSLKGASRISAPIVFSTLTESEHLGSCDILKLGPRGELLFYWRPGVPCVDFRPHVVGNKSYYSYQAVDAAERTLGSFGPRTIVDERLNVVETAAHDFDGHDFHWLGPAHWIGIEKSIDRLPNGTAYLNRHVRERKNGAIVFEWSLKDFERFAGTAAAPQSSLVSFNDEIVFNYIHMNTIQLLPKSGLLVGLGHNGVAYLDRSTKKIQWVLGGLSDHFSLRYDQHPFFSHGATFDPESNRVWLLSNYLPNKLVGNSSRVMSYDLDLARRELKEARVFHRYSNISLQMGGIEVFGDLVSLSTGNQLHHGGADLVELSPQGEHFSLNFISSGPVVYRFYRLKDKP